MTKAQGTTFVVVNGSKLYQLGYENVITILNERLKPRGVRPLWQLQTYEQVVGMRRRGQSIRLSIVGKGGFVDDYLKVEKACGNRTSGHSFLIEEGCWEDLWKFIVHKYVTRVRRMVCEGKVEVQKILECEDEDNPTGVHNLHEVQLERQADMGLAKLASQQRG